MWRVTWAHPEFGQVLASCSFDRTAAVWEEIVGESNDKLRGQSHWVRHLLVLGVLGRRVHDLQGISVFPRTLQALDKMLSLFSVFTSSTFPLPCFSSTCLFNFVLGLKWYSGTLMALFNDNFHDKSAVFALS